MKHPAPAPPELGTLDGLAYALFLPDDPPEAGVVIVHGGGSAKESHFDFARAARAHGMAALAFDARGHGRSDGAFGPSALDDVLAMCDLLRRHAPEVAIRGSSLGGFCAICAAARDPRTAAVVAICPAPEDFLLRGLRSGELEMEVDVDAAEEWLEGLSLSRAATSLSPHTALLLMHAEGDEQVPYTVTEELYRDAGEPKRLLVLPGGHHRSIQHDGELQGESLRFVETAVRRRRATGRAD
jgi:alpha-beta hydrolase superfamily lysophospholipase